MRRELFDALSMNIQTILPREVVEIILIYAYDIRCGRSSVQYFFWLHPQIECPPERPKCLERAKRYGGIRPIRRDMG